MQKQELNRKIPGLAVKRAVLSLGLLTVMLVGFNCSSGSPATTPATTPALTTSLTTSTPATTKATTPVTTSAAPTAKPTTAPSTTPKTTPTTSAPSGNNPSHLTVDIEQIETNGFKLLWLRPLNDVGSIMIVDGQVDAKLWIIKDGKDVLVSEWKQVPFGPDNYTLISKGAEVSLLYPNKEEHDYDEPGNLEVNLVLKDGTKLSARLEKISLHPTAIT